MSAPLSDDPFGTEPIAEVHLPRAPLVHVVAQIRFPLVLGLTTEDGVAPFHAAIRQSYPVLRKEQVMEVLLAPEGVTAKPDQNAALWRMQSKAGDWQVTLSDSFIALDTSAYESRDDFCTRLGGLLDALAATVRPALAERIGIRYVNRFDHDQLDRLREFVRPEMLGSWLIPLPDGMQLHHTISESVFTTGATQLLARWGLLPPNAVLDPVIAPTSSRSWVLDIDGSESARIDFEPGAVVATTGALADRAYRLFRWAVSDTFLTEAGAEL